MMKTLFDALSAIAKILAPFAPPDERRALASKLVGARAGTENENIAFRYIDIGRLFHPADETAAARLAEELKAAREAGELQSILPKDMRHIFPSDLLTWPPCPPVEADNPLSYWLPVTATASGTSAIVGAGKTAQDAPNDGDATAIRCGSNPARVYRAWIAEQAKKLVEQGDTMDTLGERIRKIAEERNYRNEGGDPIPLATVIKAIPALTTGGRGKNGRKPAKLIRPAKSN